MVAVNTSSTVIASQSSSGEWADSSSDNPDISGNGRFVVFEAAADNLGYGEKATSTRDVYIRDTLLGTTKLVSIDTDGGYGSAPSTMASVSDDGRYVTFMTASRNLVPGDTGTGVQIYVRDMHAGSTFRVSQNGSQAAYDSVNPKLTSDGRYIVYESSGAMAGPDGNGAATDVFRYDVATGETLLVSRTSAGAAANGASTRADISDDGRYVMFQSEATNLAAGDANGAPDVFVRDMETGAVTCVSVGAGGQPAGEAIAESISVDGRFVTFTSRNAVTGGETLYPNVYMRDTLTGTTTAISVTTSSAFATAGGYESDVSANGRYVVFASDSTDLVAGDTNSNVDIFLRDTVAGTTTRLSMGWDGAQANASSADPEISDDGLSVVFRSYATNLTRGPSDGALHTYRISLFATEGFDTLLGTDGADSIKGLGGADVIRTGLGNDLLDGGTGGDQMYGGVGSDTYTVDNIGDRVIELNQSGIDLVQSTVSFSLAGGFAENLQLQGGAVINGTGNELANDIFGNSGRNILDGGLRADTLTGGGGQDLFQFTTALGASNIDRIADFNPVQDFIRIDDAVFRGMVRGNLTAAEFHKGAGVTTAADAADRIIYNTTNGALYFDRDGSNNLYNPIQFASLSGSPDTLTHADIIVI